MPVRKTQINFNEFLKPKCGPACQCGVAGDSDIREVCSCSQALLQRPPLASHEKDRGLGSSLR